ncbi:cupin domain-containing protein [Paracoccus siganidrum]|uniref:Cupin domain-containing protein n=1 Tax=Paracoccus siganidrum TaxID=1276757 RepID=A0A419A5T9_9RHOB|nr:cupin domain-containing protein [Paracoccus siganidrum]RJL12328.1 cupin domain-containing protein [Paracoccus siganidrum]RMC29881.1 hypothetical protein C9E82_19535 [Paracoccus siganidrum]
MNPILIRVEHDDAFTAPAPVGAPTSAQVATTRTAGHADTPAGGAGIWECTPGRFRRQVAPAEYSYIIEGEGSFTPDGGQPVAFRAGDAMFFAAGTQGEWDIRTTLRKAYLILG